MVFFIGRFDVPRLGIGGTGRAFWKNRIGRGRKMNEFVRLRKEKLADVVVGNLKKHFFDAYSCATAAEARDLAISLIPVGSTIGWGGSATIDAIGIKDALRGGNYRLFDRDLAKTPEERVRIMRSALTADVFLMSSNAVSADGQLVNIDANGNRVAALVYGPKSVIVVVGMNKVEATLDLSMARAEMVAAPINAGRFPGKTPCRVSGACGHCFSADSICATVAITRLSKPANRIKVILVNEDLGF